MTLSTTAGITTLDDLRAHLQWAIELEHATLPPYLCAPIRWSPSGTRRQLRWLAASSMPHGDGSLRIGLRPFGTTALDQFLRIESPAPPGAPTQPDGYATIGQFYAAIEDGTRSLCRELEERAVFVGDTARQIPDVHIGHAGGRAIAVRDLASALDALGEIVEQGEGAGRTEVWDGDHAVLHPSARRGRALLPLRRAESRKAIPGGGHSAVRPHRRRARRRSRWSPADAAEHRTALDPCRPAPIPSTIDRASRHHDREAPTAAAQLRQPPLRRRVRRVVGGK